MPLDASSASLILVYKDMRLYRLSPIDLSDISWERSRHLGEAVIRAEDEHEARLVASELWHSGPGADGVFINPWSRPSFSTCEEIIDGPYDTDGPAEVLEPNPAALPLTSEAGQS